MAAVSPSLISRGGNEGSEFVCRAIVIAAPASSIQGQAMVLAAPDPDFSFIFSLYSLLYRQHLRPVIAA